MIYAWLTLQKQPSLLYRRNKMPDYGLILIALAVYMGLKAVAESIENLAGDVAELICDEESDDA